ncbi:hypothetical protein Bca52824_015696 [Brassica carinata]|uniref:Uncharacterized protein n=1 Tax=Brassica carinata TaxID=52824 RepID=A0A8X7W5I8_BRACI|nr:hypothetical protein Bca52824_015696 [Brassica carinata]
MGIKPGIKGPSMVTGELIGLMGFFPNEGEVSLCLRIGVKQGGCSGMSYSMDFENRANARPDDSTIEYQGFAIDLRL